MTTADAVLSELRRLGRAEHRDGMGHFGIDATRAYGVRTPDMRALAKRLGRDHELARALWATGQHEARHVAFMIADPARMDDVLLETWVSGLNSWDHCDGFCNGLARFTAEPWALVEAWATREEEFVRRAGFALLACLAVHDKAAPDRRFLDALALIEAAADDNRNFVSKAVNWALRQIGKRSIALHGPALALAEKLAARADTSARWIGHDARRELASEKVQAKLAARHA
ncbi:MAG: DNA alkylation repair protein [Alphaproteobacteria bacterium]